MNDATLANASTRAERIIAPDAPLFLSRLVLNARHREVQKALNDPYQMHRLLSLAFGDGADYQAARVLFRVDDDEKSPLHVLVQSLKAPDWKQLPREYSRGPIAEKEWNPSFQDGQILSFRLLANVSKREFLRRGQNGKRRGIYGEIEQLQWLARQGERGGFAFQLVPRLWKRRDENGNEVESVVEVPDVSSLMIGHRESEEREYSRDARFTRLHAHIAEKRDGDNSERRGDGNKRDATIHRAKFCAVRFEGRLYVTDADAFAVALRGGIGPAKGLGFGLLSLARA